jgi:N4-gp56 family major capsid protein
MPAQEYATATPRIAKLKGEILRHAVPREVLGITGQQHKMSKNMSDTVVYRRWLPFGGTTGATVPGTVTINAWVVDENDHLTQEGVTPDADTLTPQDITVQLNQYSCLYMYTDKTADLYEDNIPDPMKKQTGQRMGLVREKIRYGALKGGTNKYYAGGTTRATVDEKISLGLLRNVTRGLENNRADQITQILAPSPNYNTSAVEAGFLVFCHTDVENDIREIPGFVECANYGSRKVAHERELGAVDRYRFICSPELSSIADSGAAIGATGLMSTTGANIDVYPTIVVADDAWGDVALRGMSAFGVTHIPHTQKDKNDPHGQRGYIGSIFWSAAFIQNDGWMAVLEVGVTDL